MNLENISDLTVSQMADLVREGAHSTDIVNQLKNEHRKYGDSHLITILSIHLDAAIHILALHKDFQESVSKLNTDEKEKV